MLDTRGNVRSPSPFHIEYNSNLSRSTLKRYTRLRVSAMSSVTMVVMLDQWLVSYRTVPPAGRKQSAICGALWVSFSTSPTKI